MGPDPEFAIVRFTRTHMGQDEELKAAAFLAKTNRSACWSPLHVKIKAWVGFHLANSHAAVAELGTEQDRKCHRHRRFSPCSLPSSNHIQGSITR
ncbi:hypothetical protein SAY86_010407 [Trapa natans]|uniref:Uncharacterized protein n=1 Tax=Trapa natans TaxID=22666 RepID=A0AAN7R075_TRANT|nr:hypothetical protein SAY86_010407 [Trapa natans]